MTTTTHSPARCGARAAMRLLAEVQVLLRGIESPAAERLNNNVRQAATLVVTR